MSKIQQAVPDLGFHNSPYYLKQLGYTERQINRAVENGELRWTRNGNLEATSAITKYLSTIGRKGGKKSRRSLDSETARKMAEKSAATRRAKKEHK